MNSLILCCPNRQELSIILAAVRFMLQRRGILQPPVCLRSVKELVSYLERATIPGILICDASADAVLPVLDQMRAKSSVMKMVLLADGTINHSRYIRPTILPTALLWRPIDSEQVRQRFGEVLNTMPAEMNGDKTKSTEMFTIDIRGIVRQFPFQQILFFESRDKRLYLHLHRREVPFPGTLEKLLESLPDSFLRVHKSFIVNRTRIAEIQFGQNTLELEGGMIIPTSRSYKSAVKAVFS